MSKVNEKLKVMTINYKQASRLEKKREILEEIYFSEKTPDDFLEMLNMARCHNLDLEFHKAILDSFFETPFTGETLSAVYKKLKGRVLDNYFIGNIYRKNMTFKTLEGLYYQLEADKNLADKVFTVMINTAISLDNYIFLLSQNKLDTDLENRLLTETKRQNGCLGFWVRAIERAKSDSALMHYAENLLRQKVIRRTFESAHEFYLEHAETKAASLLLEILANMAETEKEVNAVLYLTTKDHLAFQIAKQKKKKLED